MNDAPQPQSRIALLAGRRVLLAVTGSVAAYKAVDLASKLTQAGAEVDVIMSEAASRFVSPLTFHSVTGRAAYDEEDLWGPDTHILHVQLAREADVFVVAPATANTIFKLAYGVADSLVSLAALAVGCPTMIAPAMDVDMYANPAVKANLEILHARGLYVAGPGTGRMASGLVGQGRLLEPSELFGHVRVMLGRSGPLHGERVLVTAGGTQEPIDPARVITNRSSGKQGFALAQAAIDRGADVTLVAAPTYLATPVGAERVDVMTAAQMRQAVLERLPQASVLLMAAAVADFRPVGVADSKIKKAQGAPKLDLTPTEDILEAVGEGRKESGHPAVVVGFAAESDDLVENARTKLIDKGLSLIVANDILADKAGFAVDTNRVTLIDADGGVEELPLLSKSQVAEKVIDRVVGWLKDEG